MAYKNIDIKELGLKQRITYKASRYAFFVPRLLSKLAKKVVVSPITKMVSGQEYEDVKVAAVDLAKQIQSEKANEMTDRITEGRQNLEDWKNDKEYYIGNLGKYKSYEATINDLEKKQIRLMRSPRKLLVAKSYLDVMKAFRAQFKEEKENKKAAEAIVREYESKKLAVENKRKEIETLREQISSLEATLQTATLDLKNLDFNASVFEADNKDIINMYGKASDIELGNVVNSSFDPTYTVSRGPRI